MRIPGTSKKWLAGTGLLAVAVLCTAVLVNDHAPSAAKKFSLVSPIHLLASVGNTTATSTSTTTVPTRAQINANPTASAQTPSIQDTSAASDSISSTTEQARELSASGTQLLKSVVNIVCVSAVTSIPTISGSGIIIDPRGIIVTAAHVAQLFLLQDYLGPSKVECLVRTGSPARRAYTAEPIFVSQSWINANPSTLTSASPIGTGQYDVALLGITGTATSTPVPTVFPYVPLGTTNPQVGDRVAIASYGAQYLTSTELNYSLYPILTFGPIQNRYTFTNNTVDIISISGTAASQEGSSGGGVANALGQLIGIITTSSISGDFQSRMLNAITPLHLRATYLKDTGNDLDATLQDNSVSTLVSDFSEQSKTLGAQLVKDIGAN